MLRNPVPKNLPQVKLTALAYLAMNSKISRASVK